MLSKEDRQRAIQAFMQIQAQSVQATSTLESRLALLERQLADKLRLLEELQKEKAHLRRPVCEPPIRAQPDHGSHASSWLSTGGGLHALRKAHTPSVLITNGPPYPHHHVRPIVFLTPLMTPCRDIGYPRRAAPWPSRGMSRR